MTSRRSSAAARPADARRPRYPHVPTPPTPKDAPGPHYKWVALSNTTIAVLLATIDSSIMLIALPAIFRGIHLDPLSPGNSFYLLWMILGFLIVSSVLVVGLGRLGDIYGRVRMYNLGFLVFTVASLVLTVDPFVGQAGAIWLIVGRLVQGFGAAFLMANSSAILTDAFPPEERGLALGINNVAAISGSFIGLVLGGILASVDWRLVFLVPVPFALFGTVWSYLKLRELAPRQPAPIDWVGNLSFAVGLVLLMLGITDGIEPAGTQPMGWTSAPVLILLASGTAALVVFTIHEIRARHPMFRLGLFRIRAFTYGTLSTFLASIGRGGLMFMLVIWLQGLWLPQHGYSYASTPLWAGILILPLTFGFLVSGPLAGRLSDRHGARWFATGGMVATSLSFLALLLLPVDFRYTDFAVILVLSGLAMGAFAAPNRAAVMNSLPPAERGVGGGHERHVPKRRPGAFDRNFLQSCHRRTLDYARPHLDTEPPPPRRPDHASRPCRPTSAGLGALLRLSRHQPGADTSWAARSCLSALSRPSCAPGPKLFPPPHHPAIPQRTSGRFPFWSPRLAPCGGGVMVSGRTLCPPRGGADPRPRGVLKPRL